MKNALCVSDKDKEETGVGLQSGHGERKKDRSMLEKSMIASLVLILVSSLFFVGSTLSWFSQEVTVDCGTITAAETWATQTAAQPETHTITVSLEDLGGAAAVPAAENSGDAAPESPQTPAAEVSPVSGSYQTTEITLTVLGTTSGYLAVQYKDSTYYSDSLASGESETLTVLGTENPFTVEACWGTPPGGKTLDELRNVLNGEIKEEEARLTEELSQKLRTALDEELAKQKAETSAAEQEGDKPTEQENGETTETGNGETAETGDGETGETGNGETTETGDGETAETGNGETTDAGDGGAQDDEESSGQTSV